MKKLYLFLGSLIALMLLCNAQVWAQNLLYSNDFESGLNGSIIVGNGVVESSGDANHGMVFHNSAGGQAVRTNYLQLPNTIFSDLQTAGTHEATISFWVNKGTATGYYWSPIFSAYSVAPSPNNGMPMFVLETRGWAQVNDGVGNWCDFSSSQRDFGSESTTWTDDGNWHFYTATMTSTSLKIYIDGVAVHSWTIDGTSSGGINGLLVNGSLYSYITLGGNQAWNWGDPDPAFLFDKVKIYDGALSSDEVTGLMYTDSPVALTADLSDITVDGGTLDLIPAFDPARTSYVVTIPAGTSSVNVSATKADAAETIVSGTGVISINNGVGETNIVVKSAGDIATKTYNLKFKEECFSQFYPAKTNLIDDPTISDLSNFGGWEWTSGARNFNTDFDYTYCGATSGSVGAAADGTASLDYVLNGKLSANTTYRVRARIYASTGVFNFGAYNVDASPFETYTTKNGEWEWMDFVFTTGSGINTSNCGLYFNNYSKDGRDGYIDNWEIYDISDQATLKSLSANVGTLTPAFDPDVTDYTLIYHEEDKSVTIDASTLDPKATVAGTGTYTISSTDTIHVVTKSKDGTATETYNVKLQLENLLDDVRLDDLSCDKGFLDPLYDNSIDDYSVVLPGGTQSVNLNAKTHDSGATVAGAGTIDVSSGSATATVVVTGEDGTTKRTINVSFTVSDVNYAMSLPGGTDGRLSNITIPALNVDHLPLTIELWVKPDADESGANRATVWYSRKIDETKTGFGFQYDYNTDISKVKAVWEGNAELPVAKPIPGQWNHLALVITDSTKTFYINEVPFKESGTSYEVYRFFQKLYLGWDNVDFTDPVLRGRTLKGEFDELRVWNVARTAQEIKDSEYKRLTGDETGLLGYWNFDNHHSQYATDGTKISAGHQRSLNGRINGGTYVVSDLFETMAYDSSSCVQASTASIGRGTMNGPVVKLVINTSNSKSPYALRSIDLNVLGTTDMSDVDSVSVYYTPGDKFNTSIKFGKVALGDTTFTISGDQQLGSGANYFWITFDIADSATLNNVVDAACTSFTIDNSTAMELTPTTTELMGSRKIVGQIKPPVYRIVQNVSNLILGEDSNSNYAKLYNYNGSDQSQVFTLVETDKEGQYYLISSDGTRYLHVIGSWDMGFVANPATLNNDYRYKIKYNSDGTVYIQSVTRLDRYVGTNSSNPGSSGVFYDKSMNDLCVWRLEPADGETNNSIATLGDIQMDKGSLVPGFSPYVTSYSAYFPKGTDTVNVQAIPTNPNAVVSGNGPIVVSSGDATATITVTSADGTSTKTYSVEFSEQPEIQMTHSYTFEDGTADDMVGSADGVLSGDAIVDNGALTLSGTGYVSLPADDINIPSYNSITIESVFKQAPGINDRYTVIYSFGATNPDADWMGINYILWQPTRQDNSNSKNSISCGNTSNPWTTEDGVKAPEIADTLMHYAVTVITKTEIKLYLDGQLIGTAPLTGSNSLANVSAEDAFIGKDVYPGDPLWQGSLDEMNIYDGEMDAATIAQRATQFLGSLSRDASLASLSVDSGDLSPVFDAATTTYNVSVPEGTTTVNVDATANDANATVKGTGPVDVSSGSGTATIMVTAQDGKTQMNYTIQFSIEGAFTLEHSYTFEDGTANDVVGNLDGTVMGGTINDGIYTASAEGDYIEFSGADLAINTYPSITLEAYVVQGENPGWTMLAYFGSWGGWPSYWMSIARKDDVSMTTVDAGHGAFGTSGLEPAAGERHHYVSELTNDTIYWYVDGVLASKSATPENTTIAGLTNDLAFLCYGGYKDPSWQGQVYEFNIYQGLMDAGTVSEHSASFLNTSDARLSALTTDTGTLTPEFNSATTKYALEVPEGTTTVNIAGTPFASGATVTGDGVINLSGDETIANIEVTSEDGTVTKTYTVYIKVEDPNCFAPLYDSGNMIEDPEFSAGTLADGGFGGWGPTGITIAEAYCGTGSAYIRGTCYPDGGSIDRSLNATNGNALKPNTTYRLRAMVNSQASPDTYFQFQIEGVDGDNSQFFNLPNTNGWVQFDTIFTTGATVTEHGIYFNSCTDATPEITDTCFIDNYELYEVSSDATLFDLQVDGETVTGFDASTMSYDVTVPNGTTTVNVDAMANDAGASVNGTGDVDLSSGSGTATITVTSGDGTATKTYTVDISIDTNTAVNNLESSFVKIYPTATSGVFHVAFDDAISGIITVYNLYGQVVLKKAATSAIEDISVPLAGVYLIQVQANGASTVVKVLKTE